MARYLHVPYLFLLTYSIGRYLGNETYLTLGKLGRVL